MAPRIKLQGKWLNILAGLLIAGLVYLAGRALLDSEHPDTDTPFSKKLVRASYDWLFHLTGFAQPDLSECGVIIIYIDQVSLNDLHQSPNAPMDRALHAQLLRRLADDGARAVAMDIIFDQPGPNAEADAMFAKAIHDNGRVILGVDFNRQEPDQYIVAARNLTSPYQPLADAAAGLGLVK